MNATAVLPSPPHLAGATCGEPPELRLVAALRDHGQSLVRAARVLCGNRADADDLVHDVYERALRTAARCAHHTNLRAYLHSILRNLFIDRCRRARARPRALPLEQAELTASLPLAEGDEPAPRWSELTTEQVTRAIAELPPEFRVVFELHSFERLRYGDIAARLGIAPATVGTRLCRERARLRTILAREAAVATA